MARIRERRRESTCKCEKVVGGAIERRDRDAERPCAERLSRVREATRKYAKRRAATREVLMASIENPIHGLRARGTQKYVVAVVARAVVTRDRDGPVPELRNGRDDPQVVLGVGRQGEAAVEVVRRIRALRRHSTAVGDVRHHATQDRVERDRRPLLRRRRWRWWRRRGGAIRAARHDDLCARLVLQ